MSSAQHSIFRIDKFVVPLDAREPFLAKIRETHDLLEGADGCLQNLVLEQISGPGEYNIVTIVEWRDSDAFDRAKRAAQSRHAASGFDPRTMFETLGITADLGNYQILA